MLYNDVLKEFLMECEIRNLSSRTIETYKLNNELFARWLTQEYRMEDVEKVGKIHIKGYIIHLKRSGYKETYINTKLKSLKVFFKYLIEEDYLEENIMHYIKPLKEPSNVIDTFTDDEIKRLVHYYNGKDFISVRNRLIIELLVDTGIRCTELRMLEDDFVFDYYIKLLGKGNKWRVVPISPYVQKQIIKYRRVKQAYFSNRADLNTSDYFIVTHQGEVLRRMQVLS